MHAHLVQAFRQLRKSPGFTILAVVALALGLGANTAIFSAINTLFLRPLAFPESQRLVRVWGSFPDRGMEQTVLSFPRFEALRDGQKVFSDFAAEAFTNFTLTGRGDPEQLQAQRVSQSFFPLLGVQPAIGRGFLPEEDVPGGRAVVLLSHAFWQKRFGGDPSIVGQTLTLNGMPHTVVGVLPATLGFPFNQTQVWAARVFDVEGLSVDLIHRGTGYLQVIGRLKPGVSLAAADAEIKNLGKQYGLTNTGKVDAKAGIYAVLFQDDLVRQQRPMFLALLGAVGLVLLIACANVANLLLVRFTGRRKEIAVRLALGATRSRVIAQFVTESLLTTSLAGVLGVVLAEWCVASLSRIGAEFIPRAAELSLDGTVFGFAVGLSLLTGLVLGLFPALQASSPDVVVALKESGRGTFGGRATGRFRSALFVGEVALSLVLLVGAGLLVSSFRHLQRAPLGFQPDKVAVLFVTISPGQHADTASQANFFERFQDRLSAIPGVTRVAATDGLPVAGGFARSPFVLEGETIPAVNERPAALRSLTTPGFFGTLGIPLRQGRDFTWRDRTDAPNVVIINEVMAKQLFPHGENPVGHRLITGIQSIPREIVGVVGAIRSEQLALTPQAEMYYPMAQLGELFMNVLIQTDRAPAGLGADVRTALREVDGSVPPPDVLSFSDLLRTTIADRQLMMGLIGTFAALALFLAGLGIYSVIAYNVAQRTSEFGVRLALGANPADILRLVLTEGLKLTALGLVIGLVAGLLLTRLLGSLLYEISAADPLVFGGVSAFLVAVALAACWLPARRATQVDPIVALRSE
ncbi:MAG TPA: ABC transporter permease [Candidatus Didemnitutus sp.]|nr:ABC transporter permease [Candidatus Didemnitutus sp.]